MFIQWIKILYTSPRDTISTNVITSRGFTLHSGCPLSPSLFAIFNEPLAAAIRQNDIIKGIQNKHLQQKICLYADDLLFYLQEPHSSLKETFSLINNFSLISNYTINWNKSTILNRSENTWDSATQDPLPPFTSETLNIWVLISPPGCQELFNLNYIPLLKKIQDDFKRWTNLPLSLIGRIATVKMKTLPQINYLFSMLPTTPTDQWFKSLNSSINQFYWKNKKTKISLSTLQKKKSQGGLEAPNFLL